MRINRITPNLPASAYKTYRIVSPQSTHFRPVGCSEYGCAAYENGWKSLIDERTELGQKQAYYIRRESGRKYVEAAQLNGLTEFFFEAGQQCFGEHQMRLDRPEFYYVTGGDWRGNPLGIAPRKHANAADWVEDFGEHQQRLADQQRKG